MKMRKNKVMILLLLPPVTPEKGRWVTNKCLLNDRLEVMLLLLLLNYIYSTLIVFSPLGEKSFYGDDERRIHRRFTISRRLCKYGVTRVTKIKSDMSGRTERFPQSSWKNLLNSSIKTWI
jgi:hypothetical protein